MLNPLPPALPWCLPAHCLQGKGYSVNVPLVQGIDTEQYLALFKPVMRCGAGRGGARSAGCAAAADAM